MLAMIKKKKSRTKIKPSQVVNVQSALQGRLLEVGWTKVKCRGLDIVVEEIKTGNRKIFNFVRELEEFLVKLEGVESDE